MRFRICRISALWVMNAIRRIGPPQFAHRRERSGPSTRSVVDFARPDKAVGINPVGQSGVLFDAHYSDQAAYFAEGIYKPQHLSAADKKANIRSTLTLPSALKQVCGLTSRMVIVRPVPAFPALPWPATIRLAKPPLDFRRHRCASTLALDPRGM